MKKTFCWNWKFQEIHRNGFYYVDKAGLIKELLENWGKVKLFPIVYIRLKDVDANSYKVAQGTTIKITNQEARRLEFF